MGNGVNIDVLCDVCYVVEGGVSDVEGSGKVECLILWCLVVLVTDKQMDNQTLVVVELIS